MVNFVLGYSDTSLVVVGHDRVAAVGIAGSARKVAAGYINFDPGTGAECVANVAEIDRQHVDPLPRERLGSGGRFAVHRPQHAVHQQHGAAVGQLLDQLGNEIG